MGVLPLQYEKGVTAESLGLTGNELFTITGIAEDIRPLKPVNILAKKEDGSQINFRAIARMDSKYVLRHFLEKEN